MLERICQCCNKHHAARVYEDKNAPEKREFYCLECYNRLFLDGDGDGRGTKECPYCGMELSQVEKGQLVGCAHCYKTMSEGLLPMIQKMQGVRAHKGKTPPLDKEYGDPYDFEDTVGAEYRAKAMANARYERQCRELETVIAHLKAEGDLSGAKEYGEKLTAMRNRATVEEDFVWRMRQALSKQS